MPTVEFEVGALVVVEVPELPISYAVAALALRTQPAQMHIVLLVAGIAGRGRLVLVQLPLVATLAAGDSVLPLQRIQRVVIVLKEGHFPIPLGMAAFAFLGEVALMFVVLFVAGKAGDRRLVLV